MRARFRRSGRNLGGPAFGRGHQEFFDSGETFSEKFRQIENTKLFPVLMKADSPNSSDSLATISRKALAQRWSCSVETIKRKEKVGILNPLRLGKRFLRYRLSDIEAIEKASLLAD